MIEKVWGQNAGYALSQVVSKQVKPEGERYLHNLNIALGIKNAGLLLRQVVFRYVRMKKWLQRYLLWVDEVKSVSSTKCLKVHERVFSLACHTTGLSTT